MSTLKNLAAITLCVLTSVVYSATAASGQLPVDDEHEPVTVVTRAVPIITINGKTPEELFASGELLKLVRQIPIQIPATRDDVGEDISISATRDELIGYVFRVPATNDPRQTVALDYRQTDPGFFELTVGEAAYEDRFYPKDPREILMEMYSKGEEFKMPFVIENDSIRSDPSLFMHDDRIQISAKEFQLSHGTVIASPLPLQFALKSNPFIRAVSINARPFYKEVAGVPACFNATLLEMIGNHEELKIRAAFVGALHKPAIEVLFSPAIISGAAAAAL